MSKRTRLGILGVLTAAALALIAYNLLSGPPVADAPDDAIAAARTIRERAGGGEQAKTADGVPVDANVDARTREGRFGR